VATTGETVSNRVTGERLTFVRTPESSEGRALELEGPDAELLEGIARYFETISALASEGRVDRRGLIRNPLQFALTVSELLMPGTYLSFPPPWAQRPPVTALAPLARRAGLRAYHEPPAEVREG
jgi:hypothetical protein